MTETNSPEEITGGQVTNKVLVDSDQLQLLIAQNQEIKADIIEIVKVFSVFSDLLSGKKNMMSIIPVITKLMTDEKQLSKLAYIIPIIEKYTENHVQEESGTAK